MQESAKIPSTTTTGAKTALTNVHILLEMPLNYCEDRTPMLSEATSITILSPQDDWKISEKPELMYSIKSDGNLKTIAASVDGSVVRTKTLTKNVTEEL